MNVSMERPYFQIRDKKYFTIYDPPHLLKSVRNKLMKYNFGFDNKIARWKDIINFYKKDEKLPTRLAPKLTEKHLDPNGFSKMRVKLAAQVLSHSVAAAIYTYVSLGALPSQGIGTAELLARVDEIFDCCNSPSFYDKRIKRRLLTPSSPHVEVLRNGITFFQSIKVVNPSTGEDRTGLLKCLKGWCLTLSAILSLWQTLYSEGVASFIVTRQLNQDPLENFFGSIHQHGGNSDNPTPMQFKRAYRKLFHSNLLTVISGNCEADNNETLLHLSNLENTNIPSFATGSIKKPLTITSTDYASEDMQLRIVRENAIAYVAGYLLRKAFEKHKCSKCATLANENLDSDRSTFLFFKAYQTDASMFGGLVSPSSQMLAYVTILEDKFVTYFSSLKKSVGIGNDVLHQLKQIGFIAPCNKFYHDYLLRLFIRMRIYYSLKYINRDLASSKRKNMKLVKVSHL